MDVMENVTSGPPPTLHGSVLASLSKFKSLLAALDKTAEGVLRPQNIEKTQIWEGYGRLKLWAEESNAISPPEELGSLDQLLDSNDKIHEAILDIFTQLQNMLQMGASSADAGFIKSSTDFAP
ncbi:hypothetical protein PFICI_03829 [Pestalotiopsis fici W106-1]|uniref:Uncharacterized protein n=1 Tax=Pestalotiopsis fici (strain W106-1 / CGMCC3.15140) TaxID=1229662 RepID=W3XII0_PESFW|nr:uncharacterized protein PFICI_03829 [Pestalotiopsis fici W106-1]ETS85804.1 hypothetical protein PFICI_03829 [Pestalotiopsis fici W106-1]